MKRFLSPLIVVVMVMACFAPAWGQVLNDPLQGSTIGTRDGGTFCCGGWRVDTQYNSIYWHVGTFSQGAFEYNVTGLFGGTGGCPGSLGKNELSHMYDFTFNNADNQYAPGYQNDPYKHFFRKQCEVGKTDTMEIVWQILPNFLESDTGALSWNSGNIYLFRAEWENVGGNSTLRSYRDGGLIMTQTIPGSWNPAGQSVRVAASTRRADEGAPLNAVYSNVKVFDLAGGVPAAPSITAPASGETVNSLVAYIQFSGGSHTRYQVRVNTQNNPDNGIISDTGQVDTGRFFTWSGTLSNNTTYYAFARIGSSAGWSGWSAGQQFTVNTAFVPGGIDYVKVKGNTYVNNSGPFLGLGFSHFRALQRCKFDRTRFTNDVSFMASKKFGYQRLLTMVSWCGLEIAPVTFTNPCSQSIGGWSDYDQQFKDAIDIAYGFGVKSEVTIFADAQFVMPSDSTRMAHIDRVLANIAGREHKIVLIEVGNELWQNGLPDPNDVRAKGQYIADRTPIPVALSAPNDGSDSGIVSYYSGSAADIATVHFDRDIGTIEGGWFPVRDSYRTGVSGIAPMSSNEPIGPGSSVNTENDPIKLVMAGCFAWDANIISYVFHSKAGVQSWTGCCPPSGTEVFFTSTPGVDSYEDILPFLPKELASWERNDGKATPSPFTNYAGGQANKWWPEVGGATDGCSRNISAIKNGRFVTTPIGILGGGLTLQARRPMQFKVYNPLTASIDYNLTKNANDTFTLATGTGAYVIIGDFTDVPIDPGGGGGSSTEVTIDLGITNVENGLSHPIGGDGDTVSATIGGRDCHRNMDPGFNDWYFYFAASDAYAFQGNKPTQYISVDYYDTGTTTLQLQYDGTADPYTLGPSITLTNTNTWKTVVWQITDAYYGNRQNNGADFRIFGGAGPTFYIDVVKSSINPPPNSPTCFVDNFVYADGNLNGNEAWSGSATSEITVVGQTVKINGGAGVKDAVRVVNCIDPGIGFVRIGVKVQIGVGDTTMWGVWYDDPTGNNLARWFGTGTTARGRIGGTASVTATQNLTGGWDDLVVKIYTATNQTEFFFNGASLGILDHSVTGASDIVGRLRFERVDNAAAAGHFLFFDELRIKDTDSAAPGQASNPNPANGATGVDINANLSWTAGSGATSHDVRFGTANPPPFVINQTGTTYDPGTMAVGTTYFWRIDEVNASGTTTGTVWSFTTLPLPGAASNPSPASGATGVDRNADLSWTAGSNATSHDVRFGTANPPPFVINQTGTTYDPGTMAVNTTYFWRIDEKNSSGTTTGTVWSFTTLPVPGQASSPSPANGATGVSVTTSLTWTAGSNATSHDVRFGTANPPPFQVNQTGTTYNPGLLANTTTYFWRIDEVNSSGTTTGTVWSFTTGSGPPPCFNDSFAYANGNLNGNGGWSGSATSEITVTSQTVRITGGAGAVQAVRNVNCGDPGSGVIRVAVSIMKGSGTSTMWSLWIDDASSLNLARWYGTGTTAKGRIGSTATVTTDQTLTGGWDRLVALINPTANTTQFFFNGADLGVYDHSVTGAGNVISQLRFERLDNAGAAGNTVDFDDLLIGDDPASPPGQASSPSPANGATGVATNATLSWTAGSGATSHDVRFGTANPPPFVINQTGTTYNPGTLANSTTYFWRIDEVNAGGTTTGVVWSFTTVAGGPVTISNSTFPSNAEGWTIVVWKSGTGPNGTMAWISSGGNPGGNMRAGGAGSADNTDSCLREGGEINKLISTVGYNSIQVQYDRRFETNQTGTTCTGTCTANVLEGNCADKLAVYYSTSGTGGPWTLLEAINASTVTQNVWATQTVNLPVGANNQANFALRFRWQVNRTQDKGRLDNIKVIGTP